MVHVNPPCRRRETYFAPYLPEVARDAPPLLMLHHKCAIGQNEIYQHDAPTIYPLWAMAGATRRAARGGSIWERAIPNRQPTEPTQAGVVVGWGEPPAGSSLMASAAVPAIWKLGVNTDNTLPFSSGRKMPTLMGLPAAGTIQS